jgi:hypothetical protein
MRAKTNIKAGSYRARGTKGGFIPTCKSLWRRLETSSADT